MIIFNHLTRYLRELRDGLSSSFIAEVRGFLPSLRGELPEHFGKEFHREADDV